MATSSYSNLFGTTGAGQQGSKAGIGTLFGQQAKPEMSEEERQQRQQQAQQPSQTFAQLQKQGMARPAPQMAQQAPAQPPMLRQLQQQLRPMAGGGQQVTERQIQGQQAPQEIGRMPAGYAGRPGQVSAPPPPRPQPTPGQPEVAVAIPLDQQQVTYSRQAQPQTAEQQQQMLAQARATATPETQALMQQATSLGLDANAAMMNPEGFRQYLSQQGIAAQTPQAPSQAPAAFEGFLGQLQQQLGQALSQPTGFAAPEIQQLREQGRAELEAQFSTQQERLNEELARRGLSASTIGAAGMARLGGEQARALAGLEAQILQQQAEMGQRGREQALSTLAQVTGQLGQQALGQQEVGLRAQEIEQRGAQFGETQALERERLAQQQQQFGEQLGFNREELALRGDLGRAEQQLAENRLAQEGRLEEARQGIQLKQIGQQEAQFQQTLSAEDRRFSENLKEQQAQRLQQLGISTQQLDLEAQRIKQQAALEGRQLSLQEARDTAEVEYRTQTLAQQAALEGRRLTLDEARVQADNEFRADQLRQQADQFTANLGAEEQRFVRTLKEQQDARAQQLGISTKELDLRASQIDNEARLRGEELGLTKSRDEAEISYRKDALKQEAALRGEALDEQRADRIARDTFARDQLAVEDRLRTQGIAVDRERLTAAESQFVRELDQRKEQLKATERQADLDRTLRETLGMGELTGRIGERETLAAQQQAFNQQQQQNQLFIQLAGILAQSGSTGTAGFLNQLMSALGVPNANIQNQQDTAADERFERDRFQRQPVTTPGGTTRTAPMTTTTTTRTSPQRGG